MSERKLRRERALLVTLVLMLTTMLLWREDDGTIGRFAERLRYAFFPESAQETREAMLQEKSRIAGIKSSLTLPGYLQFDVTYFYNGGANGAQAVLTVDPASVGVPGVNISDQRVFATGLRHGNVVLQRNPATGKTELRNLHFILRSSTTHEILAEKTFAGPYPWPSGDPFELASNDPAEIERLYTLCVQTLDSERNLESARRGLEQIVLADPKFIRAYDELARYHMKSNWGPAGLAQAEQDLKTALSGDPKHANSLVLLGYVYAHQQRYPEADRAFKQAEVIGTPNIWLMTNEGELYQMEKRPDQAMKAFQRAIDAPKDLPTYERARNEAFRQLLDLMESKKQYDDMDKLHARRVEMFPDDLCAKTRYSEFKLHTLGDYAAAIPLAADALQRGCKDARGALSEGYLVQWATMLKSGKDAGAADDSFRRGQALMADPVTTLYELARSPKTAIALPELAKRGFDINVQDTEGVTPLARSVLESDVAAAQALLRYGASAKKALNDDGFDVLMLAASRGNKELVQLLLKNGADAGARTKSGLNAAAIAKAQGFSAISALLSGRST